MHFNPAKYGFVKNDTAFLLRLRDNLKTDIKIL